MNRPVRPLRFEFVRARRQIPFVADYVEELEKYCDYLEKKYEIAKDLIKDCKELNKILFKKTIDALVERNKYKKALDKACEILEKATEQIVIDGKKKQDWKEYLMKEVEDE